MPPGRDDETKVAGRAAKPSVPADLASSGFQVYDFSLDQPLASWDGDEAQREVSGVTVSWPTGYFVTGPPAARGPSPSADFGRYVLLEEIGRGGMGVVYRARQKDLDRQVAIKMILASHLASTQQVERFYAEARTAAKVHHPNIVVIHEVGQCHGQHYFAMEYVPGPNLTRLLRGGPLTPEAAARHVLIVARAVEHLHSLGMVHRDLKPSNILLDDAGTPYVTDFGLAKMLGSERDATNTGAIVGTPSYMAPEQAAGRAAEVGPLSDVYSLGAILYELMVGDPPYHSDNPLETLVRVIEGEPPRPSTARPGLPPALEAICLKCLEKDPTDRYASADDLADDLERFLRGEPVEARRENLWHRVRRWGRREPALATRLGSLTAFGAIVLAHFYFLRIPGKDIPRGPIAVALVWALISMAFQVMLRRGLWPRVIHYAWSAADVALFTALVALSDVLQTSLVAGYFLLIVASGLWFRERLVWATTFLAVAAYGGLAIRENLLDQDEAPSNAYRYVIFAAALAVSGLIVAYQVKRVRTLSHYYDRRLLP